MLCKTSGLHISAPMRIQYVDPLIKTAYATKTYPHYSELLTALRKIEGVKVYTGNSAEGCNVRILGLGYFAAKGEWKTRKIPPFNGFTVAYFYKAHQDLDDKLAFIKRSGIDLVITPLPRVVEYEAITGVRTVLFPYGIDPEVYHPLDGPKTHDVGFTGGLHGSAKYAGMMEVNDVRERAVSTAKKAGAKVFFKGSDGEHSTRFLPRSEYARQLATTTAWISTNSPHMDIPSRHFQAMACGAVLLCERPHPAYNELLRDGINCVYFESDCSNLADKVKWLMANPDSANAIGDAAAKEARASHTWDNRAKWLIDIMSRLSDAAA